jgi:hypothetical protein
VKLEGWDRADREISSKSADRSCKFFITQN